MSQTTLPGTDIDLTDDDVSAIDELGNVYRRLCAELGRVIVGQNAVIEQLAICLFAREGADLSKTANAGVESILIGKPAPDFQLDMLDGKRFRLSEQKGKVIVLDFWASWCGFFMQSMPGVHKLMEEFKGRDVKYITVNSQEDQATIKSALERLKIQPATLMDIDGAAGEKYQATSLPQIVVIDTEMNVADMIIGANPDLIEQLRASIKKSLEPKKK